MVRFSRVRLAACLMCHPQVNRSRQWMRHDGGNTLQYQDHREELRTLPLKAMECEKSHRTSGEYSLRRRGHKASRRPADQACPVSYKSLKIPSASGLPDGMPSWL